MAKTQTDKAKIARKSGVAIPLGALRTEKSPVIGEFSSLIPFAQFCKKAGLEVIQLLPVLDTGTQSSPYSSLSAFALHPMYITLSDIEEFAAIKNKDKDFSDRYDALLKQKKEVRFNYKLINDEKTMLLRTLYDSGAAQKDLSGKEYASWIKSNPWVSAYCVYKALKWKYMQASWKSWNAEDKNLSKEEIASRWKDKSLEKEHQFYAWVQFVAYRQFKAACDYVRDQKLILKGDLPILLNEDSCDVWADSVLFNQKLRAGSPPDGSNPTGQNWGFPTYNWKAHEQDNFSWWKLRLKLASQFYEAYRLDHVLGFFRIWAVPEGEDTAELGHTEPYASISRTQLEKLGFDEGRIHWLSEPHIPTEALGMGRSEEARAILELFCDRLGNEDLWNFKKNIVSTADIRAVKISGATYERSQEIKNRLSRWLKNRTLIEVKKNAFVPLWQYSSTQAWQSLSDAERLHLNELFEGLAKKQEKLWEAQARKIFDALIPSVSMVPCGEDLGVDLSCLNKVLKDYGILGLHVVRWSRKWSENWQPYVSMEEYRELSVVTTSVHDSSTLRQWWDEEKESARAFETAFGDQKKSAKSETVKKPLLSDSPFSPKAASFVLEQAAKTAGVWYINPLQDWLSCDKKLWLSDAVNERVNVPGTVSDFNWTYRMKDTVEDLSENTSIIETIKKITDLHKK